MKSALKLGAGLAAFVGVLALLGGLLGVIPGIGLENPITTERVERDRPAILESLNDVSEYTAATGTFSVIIDHEDDVKYVPSVIAGEREKLLAVGEVEAMVDFADLGPDAVEVDEATGRVTITLPPVELGDVTVDHESTEVIDRDRGLLDRIGGVFSDAPTSEKDLLVGADERLMEAAEDSELRARGRINTTEMLTELLGALGHDEVVVRFAPPDDDVTP